MVPVMLILVLVLLLGGFGAGWRGGTIEPGGALGLLFLIAIVLLVISLFMPLAFGPGPVVWP